MSDKTQKTNTTMSADELEKTLGTQKPVVKAPETKSEAKTAAPEAKNPMVEQMLKALPENIQKAMAATPEPFRSDLIEGYFKVNNPNGMVDLFKTTVKTAVDKAASECLINLTGKEVVLRFPAEGESTIEMLALGTLTQKTTKVSGGGFQNRKWGECTVTDGGKVKAYDNPSVMAKGLGLRITGHSDQLHTFTHPKKAEGLDWELNFNPSKVIKVTSGDLDHPENGIHISLS